MTVVPYIDLAYLHAVAYEWAHDCGTPIAGTYLAAARAAQSGAQHELDYYR
jgi:hypothetical protein